MNALPDKSPSPRDPAEPSPVAARLLEAGETHPRVRELAEKLDQAAAGASIRLRGVAGSSGALVASLLARRPGTRLAVIAPDLDRAEGWHDDLCFFLGPDRVVYIPPHDT